MNGEEGRDRTTERLIRQSLKTSSEDATDGCLDAETIAAWVDGGLSGAALQAAESHAAGCSHCQSLIGLVANREPVSVEPERARRSWLTWLLPLTAAAMAVAIWVALPEDRGVPSQAATEVQGQSADARQSPAQELPSAMGPAATPSPAAKEEDEARAKDRQRPFDAVQPQVESRRDIQQQKADRPENEQKVLGKVAEARAEPSGASGSPPVSSDLAASRPAAPPPPAAAPSPLAQERAAARSANTFADALRNVIVSPDPAIRWRLEASTIERSDDTGASWQVVANVPAARLSGGAAPSPLVCWVIGRAGVVLRSTDGRTFVRVPFPEPLDLSGVIASDARNAFVTAADGRAFRTEDGGNTWVSR